MNNLLDVPIPSVTSLTAQNAVSIIRDILRSERSYAKLNPSALTISSRLTTADGGIDAQIDFPSNYIVPIDCIFHSGLTGFQIKSGATFKPWTKSAVRGELLNHNGELCSEVERLLRADGRYTLICTGHDLTPEQRNNSINMIAEVLSCVGFEGRKEFIDVLGASQIAEFAERYPGTASLLASDPIHEALIVAEWKNDAHMSNDFEASPEQSELIDNIRKFILGNKKHIRILGEPGLGKTRIVLEAVKDENIAPYTLYIEHGEQFGQTRLFRQILKSGRDKPLVLVIDELSESNLMDIWRHLKQRCGNLKIITLDHGKDKCHDEDIERLNAPLLSDEEIKQLLIRRLGDSRDIDRWVSICEGSPRVALAVSDNLLANPDDILKPPSTVHLWSRFLHGYGNRSEEFSRQVSCVAQHLALFNRFGYEHPIENEGKFIADMIYKVDPTIGQAIFQEIVKNLRDRKVLQGSKTLFFVPKALHIYLWKQFWENYGQFFNYDKTIDAIPKTLHAWFMDMFKYADDKASNDVVNNILRPDGFYSQHSAITSENGASFLSILAEANPKGVLKLLETTVGTWSDQVLKEMHGGRQRTVWTLGKIAVWPNLIIRSIRILARLAINENAENSNNATGTLIGLFHIGPEAASTEASPEEKLPALLMILRSSNEIECKLGLKILDAALQSRSSSLRIVGPEFQGLKQRANLWEPETYGQWRRALLLYFQTLVAETQNWPPSLRPDVCQSLLNAVEQQITIPECTELAFKVLEELISDANMPPTPLNSFFWHWQEYKSNDENAHISKRLRKIEQNHTKRNITNRFQRYVLDSDWLEWNEEFRERHNKPKKRIKDLVTALAHRIAKCPESFIEIQQLPPQWESRPAHWHFGEKLGFYDTDRILLNPLIEQALTTKYSLFIRAYLTSVNASDPSLYHSTVINFFNLKDTAWLGATIVLTTDYNDDMFVRCLASLEKGWLDPRQFAILRSGKTLQTILFKRLKHLLHILNKHGTKESRILIIEFLDIIPFNETSPFSRDFAFHIIVHTLPDKESPNESHGHHWENVCSKLLNLDIRFAQPLLDILLASITKNYSLSYNSHIQQVADNIVRTIPTDAWSVVKDHLENQLHDTNSGILSWLKNDFNLFSENHNRGAITFFPAQLVLSWIEADPENRAPLIAQAAPPSLDDTLGGQLLRPILCLYGTIDGVKSAIKNSFHSGSWTGKTSNYFKGKRDMLRQWLSAGYDPEVIKWIEEEIDYFDNIIQTEEINEEREGFY